MSKSIIYILSIFLCFSLSGCYTVIKHPLLKSEECPNEYLQGGYYHVPEYHWGFYADCYWRYDRWGYYYDWPWWYESYWWYGRGEEGDRGTWEKFGRRKDRMSPGSEGEYQSPDESKRKEKPKEGEGDKPKKTRKKPGRRR